MSVPADLDALLRACKDEPTDDHLRLVLADWLEEHGEADRAEFIRLQIQNGREDEWRPLGSATARTRELRLLRQHARDWLGGAFAGLGWCDVGVEETVSVRCQRGLVHVQTGERPLRKIASPLPATLLPWLETFESGLLLDARTWREILRGPFLEPFSTLSLSWDNPDPAVVIGLLQRARISALRLNTHRPVGAILGALADLRWFRPRLLQANPDPDALQGWAALTRSAVLSEIRELECQLPDGPDALALLASAEHLRPRALLLFGDEMAAAPLSALLRSERMAELGELLLSAYSDRGNPAVAQALADARSLRKLERLSLNSNPLEAGAADLARSPALQSVKHLKLYGCKLTSAGASLIVTSPLLRSLESLELARNDIGDQGVIALAGSPELRTLRRLDLSSCGVTAAGVRALAESPHLGQLEELNLSFNALDDSAAAALASSSTLGNLRCLRLGLTRPGSGFQALLRSGVLAKLVALYLDGVRLGPAEVAALAESPVLGGLRELILGRNELRAEGVKALCAAGWLDGLVELSLSGNAIGDEGVQALVGRLTNGTLASLQLYQNNIGAAGAKALLAWPGLPELVELSLSGNAVGAKRERELERVVQGGPSGTEEG